MLFVARCRLASLLLVVRPGAPSSILAPSSDALVTTSVLVPSSRARSPYTKEGP